MATWFILFLLGRELISITYSHFSDSPWVFPSEGWLWKFIYFLFIIFVFGIFFNLFNPIKRYLLSLAGMNHN